MTALTADRETNMKDGILQACPVAATSLVYKGSLVCNNTSGYAVAGADTSGFIFRGVAYEQADNSSGADGDKTVRVWKKGIHYFAASGMAITDVGAAVYVSDDQTVAKTTSNSVACGTIVDFVSATEVGVLIDGAAT